MVNQDQSEEIHGLRNGLSQIITGTVNPQPNEASSSTSGSTASTSGYDDDITPFPSPVLSARSLAGLSLSSDGELEPEVDEDKIITDEDRQEALEVKAKANKAFAEKDFKESIELYTQAISLNPKDSTFWNNRAMSKARMEEHGGAIADTTKAISINPSYAKAYYRRGLSYLAILRPTDAVSDFRKGSSLEPGNKAIKEQLNMTVKLIRRIEFEKAISVGESETPTQRCLSLLSTGACPLDPPNPISASTSKPLPLPIIPSDPNGRYKPTLEFVNGLIDHFKAGGKIPKRLAWEIVLGCREVLVKEKSLVDVTIEKGVHCDVVGDTHGQFYDLCNLLEKLSPPSENHMIVFNGDFVDRGSWSVEVALTLFAYKWLYPERIYLNRGNHETTDMNKVYGFEGEAKAKLGEMTFRLFSDVFTALPLATLVTASQQSSEKSLGTQAPILSPEGKKRFFIVHGGPPVSKDGVKLEEVAKIDRFGRQPGQEGMMCELLWTDPQDPKGRGPSKRGVGLAFGPDVTERWCNLNGITSIIRSHEVRQEGYEIQHDGLCCTVFSAPNYCDSTGNKGAWARIGDDGDVKFESFGCVKHPDVKPMAYSSGFGFAGGMM